MSCWCCDREGQRELWPVEQPSSSGGRRHVVELDCGGWPAGRDRRSRRAMACGPVEQWRDSASRTHDDVWWWNC